MTHKTSPLISVIVPIYNVEGHVAACVNSLRQQSLTDFEVLLIDDGSTDSSAETTLAAIEGDARFRLIYQKNQGLSGARNTGLDVAKGAFISFVDSDDQVSPDYLLRLWTALDDSGADWVSCAIQSVDSEGQGTVHSGIHGSSDLDQHRILRRYSFSTWPDVVRHYPSAWNKLYRRRLIEGLRFDAGTWFEDHSFFLQAANRTDHILHLPEALYLQTRGRAGQITSSDDDRVFDQFAVLRRMHQIMQAGPTARSEIGRGFTEIASRLVFERSTAILDPDRRARFAKAGAAFFAEHAMDYSPDWDPEIAQSWGQEMAGTLPLSVVLPWDGTHPQLLANSLTALTTGHLPGHEVLIICDTPHAASLAKNMAHHSNMRVLMRGAKAGGAGAARNYGLDHAKGTFILFLDAGDMLRPWALLAWVERLIQDGADICFSQMRRLYPAGHEPAIDYHNGFLDMRLLPDGPPSQGVFEITPALALSLDAHPSAKLFRSDFLQNTGLRFGTQRRPEWAMWLAAVLLADKVSYFDTPGADIDMSPAARREWHNPASGLALVAGHNATLRALPARVRDLLPVGWEQRLFARALAEMVYEGTYRSSFARARMIVTAMLAAVGKGYSATGLDPSIGPRTAQLMDPVNTVLTKLGMRRPIATPPAVNRATPLAFPLDRAGLFRFRANFSTNPNINVNFRGRTSSQVLFHLSLRQQEGLIVCNDQRPDLQWRAERKFAVPLPVSGATVSIHFTPPQVRVEIDGVEVLRTSRRTALARHGFMNLDQIALIDVYGHIQPLELIPQLPTSGLKLDGRLMLRAKGDFTRATLTASPDDAALPLMPATAQDGSTDMMAAFAGQLWLAVPQDSALTLTLTQDGQQSCLSITRQDIAGRISVLLSAAALTHDSALALSMLEHIRYGGLCLLLSETAQTEARRIAAFYRLIPFLDLPQTDTPPPTPRPDPITPKVETALAQLVRSHSANPLDVVKTLPISQAATPQMFLALTEYFCSQNRDFNALATLATARGVLPLPPPQGRWAISVTLPYLLHQGQFADVASLLRSLASSKNKEWVATPALAWVARETLARPDIPTAQRGDIMWAFCDFITAEAGDYWGRATCTELMAAAAHLLIHRQSLSNPTQDKITSATVQAYGLLPQFWEHLAAALDSLPPQVQRAHAAFHVVTTSDDPHERDTALATLSKLGCLNIDRYRRELLGPARVALPVSGPLGAADVITIANAPEAALRHMATPASAPVRVDLSQMVARALPNFYPNVRQAPHLNIQLAAARKIQSLLRDPQAASALTLSPLLTDMDLLAHRESRYIGFGLCAALMRGRVDNPDAQALLSDWFTRRFAQHDPQTQAAIAQIPSLRAVALPPDPAHDASPLFDTIVTVFSCKPYLNNRIPALRDGWLMQLKDLGIPYVIIVGDGPKGQAARLEGDILHLDAPDNYEGLPDKTMAAIRWVHDNTRFAHMLKIDDDCFVNAPLFFGNLSYRKYDYYGRSLTRSIGQMDRIWHQEKSTSARGRLDLDRSPEPSAYADGGSGYTLSRFAMEQALAAADSPEGRQLLSCSFMEDKVLGDLLAMRSIAPVDEDYHIAIRRRSFGAAQPVSLWLNSFYPSQTAPIVQVHMDTHLGQAQALARLQTPGLWPKKIWPGFQSAQLGYQSNALELVTAEASAIAAREADIAVVACMRNEMFMLPHFLAHYRGLGVTAFLIADNCSDDGTLEYLADQPDVALFSVDTDYRLSQYGVAWQQAMLSAFRVGKWSLMADADELLVWQRTQTETLLDLLSSGDFTNADAARIFMLDMYPQGPLEAATFTRNPFEEAGFADRIPFLTDTLSRGPYSDAPNWTSALRHRLIPGSRRNLFVAQKLALLRYQPWMNLSAGLHYVSGTKLSPRELMFGHFKYNADFRRKAVAEVARGQHFNDAEEYRKYMTLTEEGRSTIYDPDLSIPWHDAPFVKRLLE